MNLKNLFGRKDMEVYKESEVQLQKQNKDNQFVAQWMWVMFLISLSQVLFQKVIQIRTFWMAVSVLIFLFIHSLRVSIKQNRIMLLILRR